MNDPNTPSPEGHGWKFTTDGDAQVLAIDWMDGASAPEAVLELLSCKCRKSCKAPQCPCVVNRLVCSDMCTLKTCENQPPESDSELDLSSDNDSEPEEF